MSSFGDLGDTQVAQRLGGGFDGVLGCLLQESGLLPMISVTR